ncbi:MAG: peptidase M28 family protein [Flavobacteriales bacterium CG_4_9_14_0_2_um_filter_35_242]|nr:M20/M25/M40 family metallo-hydrolase [Zetaproteobacteria bacterium]NDK18781.1 M20/M25/M40 family metallo-hydrolase [Flavobacteriales bacterium]OIO12672.1 MAG: peptidase M28 family protein [Flavobacteriaceae bacterium CG1_02_35_72]PIX07872.1 MAG: peptidase M28 family protein [Flavobacteriales bacterium CG_4_8_14_3_um_filter_35_10]PJA04690.1 MAG: peptidase M28 family protein [Flavobacteriales bacterium CG_4_10_14_0_2_um_filter_35_18]PJC60302.1 MAG: peptidase M28 family protein [Flavobacterial
MIKKRIYLLTLMISLTGFSQESFHDSIKIKEIFHQSLTNGKSYEWLSYLTQNIGGRLSGSANAQKAVDWGKKELEKLGLNKVWLQPVMVPHWERGEKEEAFILDKKGRISVPICALGGSIATKKGGVTAQVIEVQSVDEVEALGEQVRGKIVFYNRPMDPDLIRTFQAYGGAVNQRFDGARVAGKYGAVGAIIRSINLRLDDIPHTGVMSYGDLTEAQKVPTAAISTIAANQLSALLKTNPDTRFYFKQSCQTFPDALSFNVIGELTGSSVPNEYIVVGGHLDSWDLAEGAQDDGAGIVQSMEVLRIFKELNYKPKRSIRVVLYMNEENGSRGGKEYARVALERNEKHIAALESDAGGFTPRGFGFNCNEANYQQVLKWKPLFEPYLVHVFAKGGGGSDVGPLQNEHNVIFGLQPDSQRYFDYHHTSIDKLDIVNKREVELGAAAMTAMIYLFDKYGIK